MSTMMIETPAWYWKGAIPCSHPLCMETGMPMCEYTAMSWGQDEEFLSKPHTLLECNGRCKQPFHDVTSIQVAWAEEFGMGWGDLAMIWDEEELARETSEQKRAKELARAKAEAEAKLEQEAIRMANYMADVQLKMGCKENRGRAKIQKPCKNLYYTPGVEGRMQNNVCSECWAHEYHHPKTGQLIRATADKECPYLHPGQPGWLKEWNTNRHFATAAPATRDFGDLRGGGGWKGTNKRR